MNNPAKRGYTTRLSERRLNLSSRGRPRDGFCNLCTDANTFVICLDPFLWPLGEEVRETSKVMVRGVLKLET